MLKNVRRVLPKKRENNCFVRVKWTRSCSWGLIYLLIFIFYYTIKNISYILWPLMHIYYN